MPTTNAPLAELAYTTYITSLALPWAHRYADLPPGQRRAWEAVAAVLEAHLKESDVGATEPPC